MLPNKGQSQIKPGERYEPLWSPLIPEPVHWSPEKKREQVNSGNKKDTPTTEKYDKYFNY